MGQTLSHGVYLPNEGERNCYAGLASNWQILNTAVGAIAEKAPLVHTHTVSQITDFPAYGTTAGTICEGNDSRLSDARTPVAHTHTKSDVTDLFNSANTWTGDNTYTKYQNAVLNGTEIGVAPNSQNRNGLVFQDKNNATLGWVRTVYDPSGDLSIEMLVTNKYSNGALNPAGTQLYQGAKQTLTASGDSYFSWSGRVNNNVVPRTNKSYDLGSSSYQWKTLNGINPGALSLPDYNNMLDVTSEVPIASLDGNTGINLNDYVPNITGWLSIVIANTTGNFIKATQGRAGTAVGYNASRSYHSGAEDNEVISLFMPIIADTWKSTWIKASSLIQMRFYYCLGNV